MSTTLERHCSERLWLLLTALMLVVLVESAFADGPATAKPDDAKKRAGELAGRILDEALPATERQKLIAEHPELGAALIESMVADLKVGTPEEYRRIPWIWRCAIAAGRRNQPDEIAGFLRVSLPGPGEPLRDWQAVVIGGGLINGITQAGAWPRKQLEMIVKDDPSLRSRWTRALDLASKMADDATVPNGTRYDALRMLGVTDWDQRGSQLFRYLLAGVNDELQMGAISAIGDLDTPCAAQALLSGAAHYSETNRGLMLDALLRDDSRVQALLDAIAHGRIRKELLGPERIEKLKHMGKSALRKRIHQILESKDGDR